MKDISNSRDVTFKYSADGLADAEWFSAWDGYELRAISKNTMKSLFGSPIKIYDANEIRFSWLEFVKTLYIYIRDSTSGKLYYVDLKATLETSSASSSSESVSYDLGLRG